MQKWIDILKNNDFIAAKQYIKKGADLNEENENGESVLATAIRHHCDDDLIHLLIDSGADIYDFDNEGVSIFDMAITYNNLYVFNHIIESGIDVNKTNRRSGFTPLMCAACYGRVEIAKLLLENGADKNSLDSRGFSALDFARKMNKKSVLEVLDYDKELPLNRGYTK
ncbi:ankyrin repeat domain-containing protein [Sulfurimonas sp.]|uniref:ankyrin repeat domain-containing protein n=1 Tax=Sulfurimonas sp. TaxID=2022749 RepID=UPI0035616209